MSSSVPLPSVGRALARISVLRGERDSGAPVGGGDSRSAILAFIEAAGGVVRVEEISEGVGLHVNTVRGHLDALLASGRITRIPDQRSSRGRPHWLYSATSAASIRELGRALEVELDSSTAPEVARRAAAGWAKAFPVPEPAASIDEAVEQATTALSAFGFDAVRNPVGDEVTLRACPYASMVEEQPVICDIHAALLTEVLARTEQPVTLDRLDVWPRPGLCVAHLTRPDTDPAWSVGLAPAPRSKRRKRGA